MNTITMSHSLLRWFILLTGAANALRLAVACLRSTDITRTDRTLMVAFVGLIDVQAVLGIAVFLTNGGGISAALQNTSAVLPHGSIMFLALLAATVVTLLLISPRV